MNHRITPSQARVLRFIIAWSETYAYPPTNSEIAQAIQTTPENARQLVNRLLRAGFIRKNPNIPRSITVTSKVEEIKEFL